MDSVAGDSVAVKQVEAAVALYLRRVSTKHDTTNIIEVSQYLTVLSRQGGCGLPVLPLPLRALVGVVYLPFPLPNNMMLSL